MEAPPAPTQATALTIAAGEGLRVVSVRLAVATPDAGLALTGVDGSGWQAAVEPELGQVQLFQLVDGTLEARGTASATVADGATLALFERAGRIGVAVDGEALEIDGFFGTERDLDAGGVVPTAAVLIAGSGQASFDQLAFG